MGGGAGYTIKYKIDLKDVDFSRMDTTEGVLATTMEFFPDTPLPTVTVSDFEIESYDQYQKISQHVAVKLEKISIEFPTFESQNIQDKFLEALDAMIRHQGGNEFVRECVDNTFETMIGRGSIRTLMPYQFTASAPYVTSDYVLGELSIFDLIVKVELKIDEELKEFVDNVTYNGNVDYEYCLDVSPGTNIVRYFNSKEEAIEIYGFDIVDEIVEFTAKNGETIYRLEIEVPDFFEKEDECVAFCKKNGLRRYFIITNQFDYEGSIVDFFSEAVELRG